ncbi:helix-hairpin-helix domain-containing protein [Chryseobacterium bernardetii]|uniref:helix-hairpin-helix domain-containing protein n=1 Tax=Chryseobacterium bernardetii TaxID=1241978 RepID=UPI003AF80119
MMRKNYYHKLAFMVILLAVLLAFQKYTSRDKEPFPEIKFIANTSITANITDFDPNILTAEQWQRFGFSAKQASTILKYKDIVGGTFTSKEQLKKCYAISDEKFEELKPFILLPEASAENNSKNANSFEKKEITVTGKFNPDLKTSHDWVKMGFSERQAEAILKYKNYLGGSFISKEKFRECFIISQENYNKLEPYLLLPAKAPENFKAAHKAKIQYYSFDPNLLDITFRQLIEFGLDEKSAGSIIGFRKKLRGFINKQQIMDTYNIDKELVQKLISIAPLDASNVPKYTLTEAPEDWLKDHPYFRYSADKIIFYRTTYPDDKKILKLLKLKPEYEERMKLYLK